MMLKKIVALFTIIFFYNIGYTQICSNYKILPDTVNVNTSTLFSVQELMLGGPPTLWVCNWIDFENNGVQNCINSSNCLYTFTTGGVHLVSFQINEPFVGNTEVCTSSVYVNNCGVGTLTAKANNETDSLLACVGTPILLSLNMQGAQNCPGNWEYSWYNGANYFDGMGFFSTEEMWDPSFAQIGFANMSLATNFMGKVRCSTFSNCTDSSTVFVGIKSSVQPPVFSQGLVDIRCQAGDTLIYTASSLYADSIKYMIDTASFNNGCHINSDNGILSFNSNHSGVTQISAQAFGCNGPVTASYFVNTHPLPMLVTSQDTTFTCYGSWLDLPITLSGMPPFELVYSNGIANDTINTSLFQYTFQTYIDSSVVIDFLSLKDDNCVDNNFQSHVVLASPKAVSLLVSDTIVCAHSYLLLDAGSGYDSYSWSHGNSIFHTLLLDTTVSGINLGNNLILVDIVNGYCQISDSILVNFSICTHLFSNESEESPILVYPTVSKGLINIVLNERLLNIDLHFQIIDLNGKIIRSIINVQNSDLKHVISIPNKGYYLLKISNEKDLLFIEKIIIN